MPGLAGRSPSHDTESDRQEVASMLQAMAHRGTSHTIWQPRPIDPCLGSCHHEPTPPLISHDSGYSLFMDGTVFDSDSEPVDAPFLLCEFRKNGTVALNRLSGDFAIAVWDAPRHELTLIRDPFGARPLYFTSSSAGFCFASEIKGLLALPHIRPILNRGRIGDFFSQNSRASTVRAPSTKGSTESPPADRSRSPTAESSPLAIGPSRPPRPTHQGLRITSMGSPTTLRRPSPAIIGNPVTPGFFSAEDSTPRPSPRWPFQWAFRHRKPFPSLPATTILIAWRAGRLKAFNPTSRFTRKAMTPRR